jgi:hypothetical protein
MLKQCRLDQEASRIMPSNIEIKARSTIWDHQRHLAEQLSHAPAQWIIQEDVFFQIRASRLKFRIFSATSGELIHYPRPDSFGQECSDYSISRTADPTGLRATLGAALGIRWIVRKQRDLPIVERSSASLSDDLHQIVVGGRSLQ